MFPTEFLPLPIGMDDHDANSIFSTCLVCSLSHHLADFLAKRNAGGKVLVSFGAEWCGPCKMFAKTLDELAFANKEVSFFKLDVDTYGDLATEYKINVLPTFMAYKNNEQVGDRLQGANRQAVEGLLEKLQ